MENLRELGVRVVRKVYLITYSRADPILCDSRQRFADLVVNAFHFNAGRVRALHWAVCREPHEGGGFHYHMSICLSDNKRWLPAKRALGALGIEVNFQERDEVFNYIGAYLYVCKSDRNVLHSNPHPDLTNVTQFRTARACAATHRRGRNRGNNAPQCNVKLSNLNVMQIIRHKNIRDETALLALAQENFDEGATGLMEFIANTPESKYKELIKKTWKAANAKATLLRGEKSRIQCIQDTLGGPCIPECGDDKTWYNLAIEVLRNNGINAYVFAAALRKLLRNGREKGVNILLTGPHDCAKTFLLRPLTKIFNCFTNPSSGSYAFVGIENKEVAFLNDLRYNTVMLPWMDFLNLLEGIEVHIPTPKSHYPEDIELTCDIPIFATSIGPITFPGKSSDPAGEEAMMATRWNEFSFSYSIPKAQQRKFKPWGRCFSQLVMAGSEMD